MNNPFKIKLTGTITCMQIVTISKFGANTDTAPGYGEVPVVLQGGGSMLSPVIEGYNLRGALRHTAGDVINEALIAAGHSRTLKLNDYYLHTLGGIKDSSKELITDLLSVPAIRDVNPLLSLFGASFPAWMQGRLSVNHAIATPGQWAAWEQTSVRRDCIRQSPGILDILSPSAKADYLEYTEAAKETQAQRATIKDLKKKAAKTRNAGGGSEEITAINDELAAQDADKKTQNSVAHILRRAGLAPGSVFSHSMVLHSPTPAEIGLLLKTLSRFAFQCRVGAGENVGMGEIAAHWDIERIHTDLTRTHLGVVDIGMDRDDSKLDHPDLKAAAAAWAVYALDPTTTMALSADAIRAKIAA